MAYTKTNWINGQAPALSAENLNKIEEGIYSNYLTIESLRADVTAHYVVDQGTSGDWTYRKWSDNTFEAWRTLTNTGVITSQSGAFYYLNASIVLPSIDINTIDYASVEYTGAELTFTKLGSITTTSIGYTFITSVARSTSTTRTVMAYIFGTYS